MKVNLGSFISAVALIAGMLLDGEYLWIPITSLIANLLGLCSHRWITSEVYGRSLWLSVALKFGVSLILFYGLVAQFFCIGLVIWWIAM
jgi:hypothetical protein